MTAPRWLLRAASMLSLLLVVGACTTDQSEAPASEDVVIFARRVFDGEQIRSDVAIRIRGDRIVDIQPMAEVAEVEADLMFSSGQTLMPGIIDLHVHIALSDVEDLLRSGVTTVRDVGNGDVLSFPGNGEPGELRLISAGPLLSAPDGLATRMFPGLTRVVHNESEARRTVRTLIDRGAGVIKVYLATKAKPQAPLVDVKTLRAITQTAHGAGLLVTAHTSDERSTARLLEGNGDELAHAPCRPVKKQTLRRAVQRDVEMVGTLHIYKRCPGSMSNALRFVKLGGTLLFGTDLGNFGIPHVLDVREIELMQRAGLSELQVLTAATKAAADQLGLSDLGRIEVGAIADLIAVSGDPREDIRMMGQVVYVMAGGEVVLGLESHPAS